VGCVDRRQAAFAARAAAGGILVVIAHRISSALRARRIMVLDGPHPLLGTHEELLSSSPLYADLLGYWDGAGGRPGLTPDSAAARR
jgi:ABC-type multidrug transport system fused ATPase/permease subunit